MCGKRILFCACCRTRKPCQLNFDINLMPVQTLSCCCYILEKKTTFFDHLYKSFCYVSTIPCSVHLIQIHAFLMWTCVRGYMRRRCENVLVKSQCLFTCSIVFINKYWYIHQHVNKHWQFDDDGDRRRNFRGNSNSLFAVKPLSCGF